MPLIKSARKRVRVSTRKSEINQLHRSGSKTAVRSASRAISAEAKDAAELGYQAASRLDRAASKGAIHRNKAARQKSRLAARLKATGIKPAAAQPKTATKPAAKKAPAKKSTTKAKK